MKNKREEEFEQKVKKFDKWVIAIVVNIFVSVVTTTIVLHFAGITF